MAVVTRTRENAGRTPDSTCFPTSFASFYFRGRPARLPRSPVPPQTSYQYTALRRYELRPPALRQPGRPPSRPPPPVHAHASLPATRYSPFGILCSPFCGSAPPPLGRSIPSFALRVLPSFPASARPRFRAVCSDVLCSISDRGRFLRVLRVLGGESSLAAARIRPSSTIRAFPSPPPRSSSILSRTNAADSPYVRAAARAWIVESSGRKAETRDAPAVTCHLSPFTRHRSSPPPPGPGYRKIPIYDPHKREHLENLRLRRSETRYYRTFKVLDEHLPPSTVPVRALSPRTTPPPRTFHKVIGRMPDRGRTHLAFLASLPSRQRRHGFYPELRQPLGTVGTLATRAHPRRTSLGGSGPRHGWSRRPWSFRRSRSWYTRSSCATG